MTISGKTEEGKFVVKNIFIITSSLTGLPLDYALQLLDNENMVVDWVDYYDESLKYGWSTKTALNRIETAVGDYFGTKHKEEVMKRLQLHIQSHTHHS